MTDYIFSPQPDITAYELAKLLPLVMYRPLTDGWLERQLAKLPPEMMRHLKLRGDDPLPPDQRSPGANDGD